MQIKSAMSKVDRRSLAALAVLIIFSFGMAWLVLSKTDDAIEEFEKMNNSRDIIDIIIKKYLNDNIPHN